MALLKLQNIDKSFLGTTILQDLQSIETTLVSFQNCTWATIQLCLGLGLLFWTAGLVSLLLIIPLASMLCDQIKSRCRVCIVNTKLTQSSSLPQR